MIVIVETFNRGGRLRRTKGLSLFKEKEALLKVLDFRPESRIHAEFVSRIHPQIIEYVTIFLTCPKYECSGDDGCFR